MEGDHDLTARAVALHVREVEAAAWRRSHVEVWTTGAQADVDIEIRARSPREDRRAVSQSRRADGATCADARGDSAALSSPGTAGGRRARRLDSTLCERAPQTGEEEAQAAVGQNDEVGVVDRVPAPRCGGCDAQTSGARDRPVQDPSLRAPLASARRHGARRRRSWRARPRRCSDRPGPSPASRSRATRRRRPRRARSRSRQPPPQGASCASGLSLPRRLRT